MNNEQDLIQIRRQLHQMPELELNTKKNSGFYRGASAGFL